jgi:hypothetical protein
MLNKDNFTMSQCSSVGIAIGYMLDAGVRFLAKAQLFSLLHNVQTDSGAHPASYIVDFGGFSLGLKRPGSNVDH